MFIYDYALATGDEMRTSGDIQAMLYSFCGMASVCCGKLFFESIAQTQHSYGAMAFNRNVFLIQ